jgi:hypothetical protein
MALPWEERVVMLSINPHAASIEDIARLAADLMDAKATIDALTAERDALVARVLELEQHIVLLENGLANAH